ncbi:retinol dehydrogenase [Plectosphaerella cucumerina]|uniref:Retinol dehydrogenase n=1 Tax=Plectosphaerella cucumerina TaxID=40658 RepID=A0A8K0X877_9PEZI|nr:retinol dehydrogenase [Plectosphaerella cucumerina]
MSMFRRSTVLPYKAPLTEHNLPDQTGKVFIVTGGNSGVGKALVDILYQRNARVWIATRSEQRTLEAIAEIKKLHPKSKGEILFLSLVLDDLTTIKASAENFLAQESRLDVVWNNAGVMHPPEGSRTAQGYELQLGVNVLGHFLFIKLLTPLLRETAKTAPVNSVRVVWVSSMTADFAPTPAIDFDNMDYHIPEGQETIYARSKSGNLLHAAEFQRRYQDSGIVSVSMNPGLLKTNLQRNFSSTQQLLVSIMGRPAKYGAYTELFAGLDASVTAKDKWITPFGRKEKPRADLVEPELGRKYWAWSEAQVEKYL